MQSFDHFISSLRKSLLQPLPGKNVQYEMASMFRRNEILALESITGFKESAVCILLYEKDGEIVFPLIERVVYDGVHSGQIAFPGGKKDETDPDLKITALRELHEETGIKVDEENVAGQLSQLYIPPSNFMVSPFVASLHQPPQFQISEFEVQQVVECSLSELLNDAIIKETIVTVANGLKIKTPYFDIRGKVVWGATAMILNELKFIIRSNDATSSFFRSR
ncbi:MAG: CoA pyrophosphatase [Bacteroidota bacterium]|nr:CoA pyrophosphatase [Bacteroidota bacterium]